MEEKEQAQASHVLRSMGHCKNSEQCVKDVYCNCPCLQCNKQDCFRPGCSCKKVHPYKASNYGYFDKIG